jgi:hypothetical protein
VALEVFLFTEYTEVVMADLGQVYKAASGLYQSMVIAKAVVGNTGSPIGSGASAGYPLRKLFGGALPADQQAATIKLSNAAGANVTQFKGRVWVFDDVFERWMPLGYGNGTTSGQLNEGNMIATVATNVVRFTQPIDLLPHYAAIYLQITDKTGTDLKLDAVLSVSL